MKVCMKLCCAMLLMILTSPSAALARAPVGTWALRVGAAKVDVTPAERELPKNSFGILDHLFARAIVLESGATTAALVTVDAGGIPDALWQTVSRQLETELKIPSTNLLLTATHTHSAGGGPRGPDYAPKIV